MSPLAQIREQRKLNMKSNTTIDMVQTDIFVRHFILLKQLLAVYNDDFVMLPKNYDHGFRLREWNFDRHISIHQNGYETNDVNIIEDYSHKIHNDKKENTLKEWDALSSTLSAIEYCNWEFVQEYMKRNGFETRYQTT